MAPKRKEEDMILDQPYVPRKHNTTIAANLATTRKLRSSIIPMSKSPFFNKLPIEIRDMIFDHLWKDAKVIIQHYQNRHYTITYDNRHDSFEPPSGNGKARWLLTNRQMMREGVRQLHQKSTWHLNDRELIRDLGHYVFDPITPSDAHTHETLIQCAIPMIFNARRRAYWLNSSGQQEIGKSVAAANTSTPLDTLCIKIVRPVKEPVAANTALGFTIDLSALQSLSAHASLCRFQVHLICGTDIAFNLRSCWELGRSFDNLVRARYLEYHFLQAWQYEVTRVGRLLVPGCKKTGYMKETTRERATGSVI